MPPPLDPLACAAFVVLAFVPAGLAHSLWLRAAWSARWRVPLDGGVTWRGVPIFGENKTWAGFVVLPVALALTFAGLRWAVEWSPTWREGVWPLSVGEYAILGGWTGLGFMIGELPNSFIKRRLGVAPGAAPRSGVMRLFGFVVDRLDSITGAFVAQAIVVPVGGWYAVYLLLVGPGLHWGFSALLYYLGVKGRRS